MQNEAEGSAGIPGARIRSFVERVERLETEIADDQPSRSKEVYAEAKAEGFDVKSPEGDRPPPQAGPERARRARDAARRLHARDGGVAAMRYAISHERVLELVEYDPNSGLFWPRQHRGGLTRNGRTGSLITSTSTRGTTPGSIFGSPLIRRTARTRASREATRAA
jgi:hypothetical protein